MEQVDPDESTVQKFLLKMKSKFFFFISSYPNEIQVSDYMKESLFRWDKND